MTTILSFVKKVSERMEQADVMGLSAQLAYFFLLSLFPFLLFLVTLIGYLPIDVPSIMMTMESYLPNDVVRLIDDNLTHLINKRRGGLLSVGIIGTIWSASNGMNAITKSFNRAYNVEKKRPFFITRLLAIIMMLGMVLVIAIALILPVFGRLIGEQFFALFELSTHFLTVWNTFRWVISSVIFFVVFLLLYTFTPHTKVYIRYSVWGAIFTTIVWQISSYGFSYYVNSIGNYSATYGSLGTVIALMIWFYLSGIIITTGGVLNAVIQDYKYHR